MALHGPERSRSGGSPEGSEVSDKVRDRSRVQDAHPVKGDGQQRRGDPALTLSRLVLSGQLRSGSKRCLPPSQPPRPSQVRYPPAQCQACGQRGRRVSGAESCHVCQSSGGSVPGAFTGMQTPAVVEGLVSPTSPVCSACLTPRRCTARAQGGQYCCVLRIVVMPTGYPWEEPSPLSGGPSSLQEFSFHPQEALPPLGAPHASPQGGPPRLPPRRRTRRMKRGP